MKVSLYYHYSIPCYSLFSREFYRYNGQSGPD